MDTSILNRSRVYSGYLKVDKINATVDNKNITVEVVERGSSSAILVIDPKTKDCIVVEQFRPAIMAPMFGLPAGMIETGQTAPEAAVRELREETNICVDESELIDLGAHYLSPGILTEKTHCFLVTLPLDKVSTPYCIDNDDESEFIQVHKKKLKELLSNPTPSASLTICCLNAQAMFQ